MSEHAPLYLDDYMTPEALRGTAELITHPSASTVRVIETLSVERELATRTVTIELELPTPHVLLPIAFPLRGDLIDTLTIEAGAGISPYTIGRQESTAIAILVLWALADAAVLGAVFTESELKAICVDVATLDARDTADVVARLRGLILSAVPDSPSARAFVWTLEFIRTRNLLLVPCDAAGPYSKVTYTYQVSQQELRNRGLRESLRNLVGRLPDDINVYAPLASKAQSYHLRLNAPTHHFVRSVVVSRRRTSDRAVRGRRLRKWETVAYRPTDGRVLGSHPDASGLCHVYARGVRAERGMEGGLFVRIRFAERPLGKVATSIAQLLAVLVALVAVTVGGPRIAGLQGAAAVSFLLALPGVLGLSAALREPLGSIRGSLIARVGSLAAALVVIVAAAALLDWTVDAGSPGMNTPAPDSVRRTLEACYAVLVLALAGCGVALLRRVFFFKRAQFLSDRRREDSHFPAAT